MNCPFTLPVFALRTTPSSQHGAIGASDWRHAHGYVPTTSLACDVPSTTLMANPLGDLLEWLFAANITTSDAFASAKALIEANVTRETLQQVTQPALAH